MRAAANPDRWSPGGAVELTFDDWRSAWQTPADEIASGGQHRLRRSDLPPWHAESSGDDPNDEFVLTVANDLRPA